MGTRQGSLLKLDPPVYDDRLFETDLVRSTGELLRPLPRVAGPQVLNRPSRLARGDLSVPSGRRRSYPRRDGADGAETKRHGHGFPGQITGTGPREGMTRSRAPSAVLFGAVLAVLAFAPGLARAEEAQSVVASFWDIDLLGPGPHYLDLGIGVFDVFERKSDSKRSAGARAEFRLGDKIYGVGPAVGALANTDGGAYGYVGLYADFRYGDLVVTPLAGLGAYHQADSSDLGGVFQFRLALGITYQFEDRSRLGITLGHISNAQIHDENPGQDEVYVSFALPF